MLKGRLEIELKNEHTGKVDKFAHENMITNAIYETLGFQVQSSGRHSDGRIDELIPLATKGLGGLFLFDGTLTEDANNIHFPLGVHLTGHAGQVQNTSSKYAGSLNVAESMQTDTGYTSVWDFSTSQANGTIASIALTNYAAGNDPFRNTCALNDYIGSSHSYAPIAFDEENAIVYGVYEDDIYKRELYTPTIRAYSPTYGDEELVCGLALTNPSQYFWSVSPGYDGYIYAVYIPETKTKQNVTVRVRKYKTTDYSFDLVGEESTFTISNITVKDSSTSSRSGLMLSICVSNGYLYIISYDRKSLYKVNLSNTVDVKEFTFDENQLWYIYPMYGGGLYAQFSFPVKTSTGETKTYYDMGIIYLDGKYRVNTQSVSSTVILAMETYAAFETERVMRLRAVSIGFDRRYLGTICNLSAPVVKTSAQSMKVTYTLTDV